jgi:RNA polymerase sigma-70 factor (ECF subfamily)
VTGAIAGLSDAELVMLALAGRDAAFGEIVRRHRDMLYRLVHHNVADADEALDLVQETFLSAHRALARYDSERPLRSWLAAIAINKCRDWARRRAVRRLFAFALPIDEAVEIATDLPGQDETAADRQQLDRVARAIAALPAALREVIVLRGVEGLSQAETAAILGITGKAVETRLHRARAKLAELIDRRAEG